MSFLTCNYKPSLLSTILDDQDAIKELELKKVGSGWVEAYLIDRDIRSLKKTLNARIGQYKRACKKGCNEFQKTVIDSLF